MKIVTGVDVLTNEKGRPLECTLILTDPQTGVITPMEIGVSGINISMSAVKPNQVMLIIPGTGVTMRVRESKPPVEGEPHLDAPEPRPRES